VNPRGAGWLFGNRPARAFNHINGFELVARAHQLVHDGFRYMFPHWKGRMRMDRTGEDSSTCFRTGRGGCGWTGLVRAKRGFKAAKLLTRILKLLIG
jgi:hypothetical protein